MTFSFSTPQATKPASGFSFGAAKPATTPGFSFGNTGMTSSGFSFGNTKPAMSSGFSFGNTDANKSSGFSFNFGKNTTNQTAQAKEQEKLKSVLKPEDHKDQLAMALTCPQLYGDERDTIISKWNQLQAAWGHGRAFRHNNMEPIKLSARNTFCRFKAMGYSRILESKDKDGIVWLQIDKPEDVVRENQQHFVSALQQLLGNNLNIAVKVEAVKQLPDNKCELAIYIQEQLTMAAGAAPSSSDIYRVPTSVLYGNLVQMEDKLKQMGVSDIINRVALTDEQINSYLETPPPGIPQVQWNEAKKHNPDPKKLCPVPMLNFEQLAKSHMHQRLVCSQQSARLEKISSKITEMSDNVTERQQKLLKFRQDASNLARKLLRLICRQEILRQSGVEGISKDEEVILANLEKVNAELKSSNKSMERIHDIKQHLKTLEQEGSINNSRFQNLEQNNILDADTQDIIAQMLEENSQKIQSIVAIVNNDLADMSALKADLSKLSD